ncbi:hypothetical protein [Persephonella sp.]
MEKIITTLFEPYPLEYNLAGIILFVLGGVSLGVLVFLLPKIAFRTPSLTFNLKKREETKIDINNPKQTAYQITFLIHKFETPYNSKLLEKLERYKYRKEVESLDSETRELIRQFIEYVRRNYGRV